MNKLQINTTFLQDEYEQTLVNYQEIKLNFNNFSFPLKSIIHNLFKISFHNYILSCVHRSILTNKPYIPMGRVLTNFEAFSKL